MKAWLQGVLLGAVGVPIVALAATGRAPLAIEFLLWTVAGVAWVFLALRYADRPWLAVLAAGAASAVFAGAMQALLLAELVANNVAWADQDVDGGGRLRAFLGAFPIGIAWGALFGAVTWAVERVRARRAGAMG